MHETELPSTCNAYVRSGRADGLEVSSGSLVAQREADMALFRVIIAYKNKAPIYPPYTFEDRKAFLQHWLATDGTDGDRRRMESPNPDDPNLCRSMITLLTSLESFQGDIGVRAMADYLYGKARAGVMPVREE